MEIRDFLPGDWDAYLGFSLQFYEGDATLYPTNEDFLRATFDACCQKSPYTRGLMLLDAGKPVGYGLLSLSWSNEVGGLEVLVEEIFLDDSQRGKGLGSRYLQWVFDQYPQARRFRLEVCAHNPAARRLYERLGFVELPYIQMVRDLPPNEN